MTFTKLQLSVIITILIFSFSWATSSPTQESRVDTEVNQGTIPTRKRDNQAIDGVQEVKGTSTEPASLSSLIDSIASNEATTSYYWAFVGGGIIVGVLLVIGVVVGGYWLYYRKLDATRDYGVWANRIRKIGGNRAPSPTKTPAAAPEAVSMLPLQSLAEERYGPEPVRISPMRPDVTQHDYVNVPNIRSGEPPQDADGYLRPACGGMIHKNTNAQPPYKGHDYQNAPTTALR